ncbi:MAG TPA: hypothetical protein VKB75_07855 [Jatrophihabitans sp.]|nr:hypothetical protein [Jatrophihabitans sp.]
MGVLPQPRLAMVIARKIFAGRGRRLLRLVVLFAAPALIMGVGTFALHALELTPDQRAHSDMGSAAGVLRPVPAEFADASDLLRAGRGRVSASAYAIHYGNTVFVDGLERETTVMTADWTSALQRSRWHLISGRWPVGENEVAVTSAARTALHAGLGRPIRIGGLAGAVNVVGVVEDPTALKSETLLGSTEFDHALAHADSNTNTVGGVGYLLTGPKQDVTAVVRAAEAAGVAATTRDHVRAIQTRSLLRRQSLIVSAPGVVLVVVLSAAAFVLRVRRAGRQGAILMALGVRPATLVWAARLAAAATAIVGAAVGTALATAVNALAAPTLGRAAGHVVDVPIFSVSSVALTVVIVATAATVAAWLPARAASRGMRRFDGSPPHTAPMYRRVVIAGGILAAAFLTAVTAHAQPIAATALAAAALAALLLVPSMLQLVASLTRRTPLLVQVATRQLARNGRRPAVAVAVGMAVMIAAAGSLTYTNTLRAVDRRADSGATHAGTAGVPLRRIGPTPRLIDQLRHAAGKDGRVGAATEIVPTGDIPRRNRLAASTYYVVDHGGRLAGDIGAVATKDDFAAITNREPTAREWRQLVSGAALHVGGGFGSYVMQADAPQPAGAEATSLSVAHGTREMVGVGPPGPAPYAGARISFTAQPSEPVSDLAHTSADFVVGPAFVAMHHLLLNTTYLYVWTGGGIDPGLGDRVRQVAEHNGIAASEVIFGTGALPPLPFDWRLVLISAIVLLWLGVGLCMLAMSEDAQAFYQSLFALGFASWRQRVVLVTQSMLIGIVGATFGTLLGLAAGVASVHALGVEPELGMGSLTLAMLVFGAVVGAGAIGAMGRSQRTTDELTV